MCVPAFAVVYGLSAPTVCTQEFINLHVDECLRRQDAAASNQNAVRPTNDVAASRKAPAGRRGPAKKLEVPPKLAAHLLSERQLREQLKRYELPIIGKKEVLHPITRALISKAHVIVLFGCSTTVNKVAMATE